MRIVNHHDTVTVNDVQLRTARLSAIGARAMPDSYLSLFPKPFLDDLVHGRVLPVVGAGLSRNAVIPPNSKMPLWDDLGKALAEELTGYPFTGALDAISAYAHEYSRIRLVERLAELLLVNVAKPGDAHGAFCALPFTTVCTTNFDFLLEQQYTLSSQFCRPIVDEDQLSVAGRETDIVLLKLHGDLHHPQRLVVTEEDYARFLDTYPLLSTYLANLLISRTPLLIGYSLDDPDFRQVWQVVNDRLGRLRRPAYAVAVDSNAADISRFARRGVRLISLPGQKSDYSQILAKTFTELRGFWSKNIVRVSQITDEDPLSQLSLPQEAKTRLCFFSVPLGLLSFYRENAFPLAEKYGFVPISANDMISPGENWLAKVEALIERAAIVVVDASTKATLLELEVATGRLQKQVFAVVEHGVTIPPKLRDVVTVRRPPLPANEPPPFLAELENWLANVAATMSPEYAAEPKRLLDLGHFNAALLSAMILLEVRLSEKVSIPVSDTRRFVSMRRVIEYAMSMGIIDHAKAAEIEGWISLRNSVAHSLSSVSAADAESVVKGVLAIIAELENPVQRKKPKRRRGS